MNDVVTFKFYSDTNQANALDELELLSLDFVFNGHGYVEVGFDDYKAMGDSIEAIVKGNGGEVLG